MNLVIKFAGGGLSVVPDLLLPGVLPGFLGLSDLGVSQLSFILAGVAFGVMPTGGVEGVPTIDLLGWSKIYCHLLGISGSNIP